MDLTPRLYRWIGLCGGIAGVLVLTCAPLDDLLPINQILFALLCALLVIWMLIVVAKIL